MEATNPSILINAQFDYSTAPKTLLNPDETFGYVKTLGRGAQGVIRLIQDRVNEKLYVIKYLNYRRTTYEDFLYEVAVLKFVSAYPECNNDIACYYDDFQLFDEVEDSTNYCILMEYVEGVDLGERIKEDKLSQKNILEIAIWLTGVLSLIHNYDIVHGDIAPNNIMITPDNYLKLIDFDLACTTKSESKNIRDCMEGESKEEDVFDAGVVLYEIANNGKYPYSKRNTVLNPSTFQIDCYNDIVEQMIDLDEENRITAIEAHNLFQQCLEESHL